MEYMEQDLQATLWLLCALGAPKDFLRLVVLIYHTTGLFNLEEDIQFLELYAGHGNLSRKMRRAGYLTVKCDFLYFRTMKQWSHGKKRRNYMDLLTPSGFILAVVLVLKGKARDLITWLGIKCSSFIGLNVGTSGRSPSNPYGNWHFPSVLQSNMLLERSICILTLVSARLGVWGLEQPGSSVLEFYPTWHHMLSCHYQLFGTRAVWNVSWWMMMYGSPSPKRSWAYSNSEAVRQLDVGWKRMKSKISTVTKYVDGKGRQRYKGSPQLKSTEQYPEPFADRIVQLRQSLLDTRSNSEKAIFRALPCPLPSGPEILDPMPEDDGGLFGFADIKSAYDYLRGAKGLNLPKHWKVQDSYLLPRELPERVPLVKRRSTSFLMEE